MVSGMSGKEKVFDQSIYSHALYFDPINQQRMLTGNGWFHFDAFENIPGIQPYSDGSFEVTYFAPGAKSVQIRGVGGSMPKTYDLTPDPEHEAYFKGTITDVCPGFHYVEFLVDGVIAMHNQLPIGYGSSYAHNFIELPDPEFGYQELRNVPHGSVRMELYYSEVTGRWRNCWVYTPPGYDEKPEKRYPVWYLQHGGGENETGWIWQGRINYIMDNMLAEGLCEEMIVVMNCGYNFQPVEGGKFILEKPAEVFAKDCVPFIDGKFRTVADREHRAISGLSFGSYHAKTTALDHPELFSALGIFSGDASPYSSKESSPIFLGAFDYRSVYEDIGKLNDILHLFYIGYGRDEDPYLRSLMQPVAEDLITRGGNVKVNSFPGYHEWNVWRRCAFDMAKLLFKW